MSDEGMAPGAQAGCGGTAATEASPADALTESLASSLREQLVAAGLDTSGLRDEVLVGIVGRLGAQSMNSARGLLESLMPPDASPDFLMLGRGIVKGLEDAGASERFPSSHEPTSLGDYPNGDFPPPEGPVGTEATDTGALERLAVEYRKAQVDHFRKTVTGGLYWLSDAITAAAIRFSAPEPASRSFGPPTRPNSTSVPFGGGEWAELQSPHQLHELFPEALRPFVPPVAPGTTGGPLPVKPATTSEGF
jgi:hypothetical protein